MVATMPASARARSAIGTEAGAGRTFPLLREGKIFGRRAADPRAEVGVVRQGSQAKGQGNIARKYRFLKHPPNGMPLGGSALRKRGPRQVSGHDLGVVTRQVERAKLGSNVRNITITPW